VARKILRNKRNPKWPKSGLVNLKCQEMKLRGLWSGIPLGGWGKGGARLNQHPEKNLRIVVVRRGKMFVGFRLTNVEKGKVYFKRGV